MRFFLAFTLIVLAGCGGKAKVEVDPKIEVDPVIPIGVGNTAVGGNQTIDSKVALAAVGILGTVCLGLVRMVRTERQVSGLLIRTIETQRVNGGEAVVNSLKFTCGKGNPLAKVLHKRVKKNTK